MPLPQGLSISRNDALPQSNLLRDLVWCFEPADSKGDVLYDLSGRGNRMFAGGTGTPGVVEVGLSRALTKGVDMEAGNTQDYSSLVVAGDFDFRNVSVTFNSFVKLESSASLMQIMGSGIYGVGPVIMLYADVSVYRFLFSYNGSSVVQATGGSPSVGTWQMVTGRLVRNNAGDLRLTLWVDGEMVDTEYTGANDLGTDVTGNFSIGARPDTAAYFFDGIIAQPAAWKRGLADLEIKQLNNYGLGTPHPFRGVP